MVALQASRNAHMLAYTGVRSYSSDSASKYETTSNNLKMSIEDPSRSLQGSFDRTRYGLF
jgi:hypothetical protein